MYFWCNQFEEYNHLPYAYKYEKIENYRKNQVKVGFIEALISEKSLKVSNYDN